MQQLIINTYGTYLKKKDDCFLLKNDEQSIEVSPKKVKSILISTSCFISSDALKLAIDNNIDVVFLDHFGDPFGRVWHCKPSSTNLIRRKQLEISSNEEGFEVAKTWVIDKISNQVNFLQHLKFKRSDLKQAIIDNYEIELLNFKNKILSLTGSANECREHLMAYEGNAGKNYFEALSILIPEKYKFEGRSKRPAEDEFNCMLNYAYGVLYSQVERSIILAGLDPYIGFIHTDDYNKKSMVFDLIEAYRHFAEETVFHLFSQKKVNDSYFDKIKDGYSLNKEGKKVLIGVFNEYLDNSVKYRGRNIKRRDTIQFDCHNLANSLIGEEK